MRRTLAAKRRYSNGHSSSTNWPTSSRVPLSVRPLLQTRAQLMSHFIAVGLELKKLQSYNSLMALLAALGSAAVHRLKLTKQKIGAK